MALGINGISGKHLAKQIRKGESTSRVLVELTGAKVRNNSPIL